MLRLQFGFDDNDIVGANRDRESDSEQERNSKEASVPGLHECLVLSRWIDS